MQYRVAINTEHDVAKSLQQKALGVLRRRKMYDVQLNNIMNQQCNVDQVQFASESIQDTISTVSTH